jgi:hypothetical protein
MFLLLEVLFYSGLLLIALAAVTLLVNLLRGRWRRLGLPLLVGSVGLAAIVGPAIYTRAILEVDLGPRERWVDGELHLTLTGWDGDSYAFLERRPETVVLQMANGDVTDATLEYLRGKKLLRELDLNDAQITDDGLERLADLQSIEVLRLRGTNITDAGFRQYLMPRERLRQVDLRQTAVEPESIDQWRALATGRRALR